MLESFLVAGRQDLPPGTRGQLVYGQSVTDACIDWDTTAIILDQLAGAMARRRSLAVSTVTTRSAQSAGIASHH